jgi:hypothetical protein
MAKSASVNVPLRAWSGKKKKLAPEFRFFIAVERVVN